MDRRWQSQAKSPSRSPSICSSAAVQQQQRTKDTVQGLRGLQSACVAYACGLQGERASSRGTSLWSRIRTGRRFLQLPMFLQQLHPSPGSSVPARAARGLNWLTGTWQALEIEPLKEGLAAGVPGSERERRRPKAHQTRADRHPEPPVLND